MDIKAIWELTLISVRTTLINGITGRNKVLELGNSEWKNGIGSTLRSFESDVNLLTVLFDFTHEVRVIDVYWGNSTKLTKVILTPQLLGISNLWRHADHIDLVQLQNLQTVLGSFGSQRRPRVPQRFAIAIAVSRKGWLIGKVLYLTVETLVVHLHFVYKN